MKRLITFFSYNIVVSATHDNLFYTTVHTHWCEIVISDKYDNLHAITTNPH